MFQNEQDFSLKKFLNSLTTNKASLIIVALGFIVFGNALFNDFVADDNIYIINEPQTHQVNILVSFGTNLFNSDGQYRPLQPIYFSILYTFFGATPFPYHVLQLLLHIISTILLYVLFRKFLSSGVALIAALVFLIHPIQVESVSYIAQTASPLFFLLGILPLLLSMRKNLSVRMLILMFTLLLLSMFEKETGVLFLFMMLIYSFLFARNNLLKLAIGGCMTLVVYAFFRLSIGNVGFATRALIPIADLTLPERLLNVPLIMFYYLKTFFYPKTLAYDQQWIITSIHMSTFYLPLVADIAFFVLTGAAGVYLLRHHKQSIFPFLFFSLWFVSGLFFHLNIFPIDATVADRWFYFPLAGLLGLLGLVCQRIANKLPYYTAMSLWLSILIIFSLALRTIVRNIDWQNFLTLETHDMQVSDNFMIEEYVGEDYGLAGEYAKAKEHFQRSVALNPYETNVYNLGIIYLYLDNVEKARTYLEMALHTKNYQYYLPHKHAANTYLGYASLLVLYDTPSFAVSFIREAIRDYPDSSDLWYLLALAYFKQHNKQAALDAASKAYELNPNGHNTSVYSQIKNNEPVTIKPFSRTFTFSSH